jgi:putative tricarboxylic transport membrane protein
MQDNGHQDAGGVSNRAMEIVTAAVLLAFSGLFLWSSYRLGFRWSADGPQSGFFPFYVSLFIFLSSLVVLFQGIVGKGAKLHETFVEWGPFKQVLSVLIPAMVFVVGVQLIGIYVAAAIYIAGFMRFIGKYGWVKSIVIALIVAVASFMMFEVWFQVPLYKGTWNPLAWTGY